MYQSCSFCKCYGPHSGVALICSRCVREYPKDQIENLQGYIKSLQSELSMVNNQYSYYMNEYYSLKKQIETLEKPK